MTRLPAAAMPAGTGRRLPAFALVLAVVVATLLPAAPALAADATGPSWSVAPADNEVGTGRANFDYALDPGATLQDAFVVQNTGPVVLALDLYAADAFTTREGRIDLLAAGTPSVDAGTWVALAASEVLLQPGERVTVPLTVSVPVDARPGDHPTGIVASLRSDDPDANVQLDRRLGSRMQLRVSGELSPSVSVSAPSVSYDGVWNPFAVGALDVSYELTNTGNARVTARTALSVAGPFGVAGTSTSMAQLDEVLPGSTIDVSQRIEGVAALLWLTGAVRVSPESVGIGARALDEELVAYALPAPPAVPLLVLVVLVAVLLIVLRRRSAARARPREDEPTGELQRA